MKQPDKTRTLQPASLSGSFYVDKQEYVGEHPVKIQFVDAINYCPSSSLNASMSFSTCSGRVAQLVQKRTAVWSGSIF